MVGGVDTEPFSGSVHDTFAVRRLGPCRVPSPLELSVVAGDFIPDYTDDLARVLVQVDYNAGSPQVIAGFERAGARQHLLSLIHI